MMGFKEALSWGFGAREVKKMMEPPPDPVRPTPDAPVATPESGVDGKDALRFRKRRSGRSDTVVAGDLIPRDIGRKTLLG